MVDDREIADRAADVVLSQPEMLAKAYRDYVRYHATLKGAGGAPVEQQRDVLCAGKVVVVLPLDAERDELVLMRQFRLPAHLANGRGELIEIVAGRVEPGESVAEAARRECTEEIGVAPAKMIEVLTYLSTPGVTDEEMTIFLAAVDASQVREGPHTTPDGERLTLFRVSVEDALAALARGAVRGSPVVVALQWLALNRQRAGELLRAG
jgi:ADP-ribose pyrophosphatase